MFVVVGGGGVMVLLHILSYIISKRIVIILTIIILNILIITNITFIMLERADKLVKDMKKTKNGCDEASLFSINFSG